MGKKNSAMKQGPCSKVNVKYPIEDCDMLSRVTPISYLLKQNKKLFTQAFISTALFSLSLLYLNPQKSDIALKKEGRKF